MSAPRSFWRALATPLSIGASTLHARLPGVFVGEACELRGSADSAESIGSGVVVAIDADVAAVSLLAASHGLSARTVVVPTGRPPQLQVNADLLGCVLDGHGAVVQRYATGVPQRLAALPGINLHGRAPGYLQRLPVQRALCTGVRAIGGLLTGGGGQRGGVFAAAGAGKTTLSEMLIERADADVLVIGLIGERGREVTELVARLQQSPQAQRSIVVQATSDAAPALRCQAALVATRVAEHFRDRGQRVLLVLDSVTRYARALRDVALSAGEPPARRGYPASVFEQLPRLLERPGRTHHGSITAFYTVLLEDEDEADAVGEEVKSLLDGHIHLSSKLAARGQFPAIDILRSGSRLFHALADEQQQRAARAVRGSLATLDDMQLMRDLGEYRPGMSAHYDDAVKREPALTAFLAQRRDEASGLQHAREALHALAG